MPHQHMLLKIQGGYASGVNGSEIWNYGIRLGIVYGALSPKGDLPENLSWFDAAEEDDVSGVHYETDFGVQASPGLTFPLLEHLQAIAGAVQTWHAGAALISQQALLQKVTLYPIEGPLGRVFEGHSATATWDTPVPGGGGTDVLPTEVASVLSWTTPRIGARGRGRVYLPARVKAGVGSDGLQTPGQIAVMGPGAVTLLHAMVYDSAVNPWEMGPIVTGRPYDKYARITGVRIGRVFDSQRRRRNALAEDYTSFVV